MKKVYKVLATILSIALVALMFASCATTGSTDAAAAEENPQSMWMMLLIYGGVIVLVYFLFIRPNSKKKKEEQALRNNLEVGDDITTIGGIVGKIVSIKEESESLIIETSADRTRLHIKNWAISTVDTEKEKPKTAKDDDGKKKGFFSRFKKDEE